MIGVVLAFAYGLAAGFFLPVATFAFGLLAGVAAAVALGFGQSSAASLVGQALAVMAFGQIGYFTAVYARAVRNDARSPKDLDRAEPSRKPARDLPDKLRVPAED